MWSSSCKLFLDIESEEDVLRHRTAPVERTASDSEATGGLSAEEDLSVRPRDRPYSTTTQSTSGFVPTLTEARLVHERVRFEVASSRPVLRLSPQREVAVKRRQSDLTSEKSHSSSSVTETLGQSLLSGAGARPFMVDSLRGADEFRSPMFNLPFAWYSLQRPVLPTVMTSLPLSRVQRPTLPAITSPLSQRNSRLFGTLDPSLRQDVCCNFCKRNGETKRFFTSHVLLDRQGRIQCPVLRSYVCPICGATGDNAHTVSYCPFSQGESTVATARTPRKSCGCKRSCRHNILKRH